MNTMPPAARAAATVFGLGLCKPASGTWGSMPPCAIALGMVLLDIYVFEQQLVAPGTLVWILVFAVMALAWSAACLGTSDRAEALWGHDPSPMVADEAAGMSLALCFLPAVAGSDWIAALVWIGAVFLLFRGFDIAKLWPADALQRLPGGMGVLLDDHAAGIYAGAIIAGAGVVLT